MNAAYQLDREWPLLAQGTLLRALPAWRDQQPPLRRFGCALQLVRFLNSSPPAQTDGPLLALLALARGDRLAGRLVLQAILPALKSQAERIAYDPERREEVWELLLFFAWEAICSYPVERRRHSIAANLVLQVLHDTTRELRKAAEHDEFTHLAPTVAPRIRAGGEPDGSAAAAALAANLAQLDPESRVLHAAACGALAERDAQLILQTRVDGIGLRLIARVEGVGYDALRKRRQRAEHQLRGLLDADERVPTTVLSDLISDAGPRSTAPPPQPQRVDAAARDAA